MIVIVATSPRLKHRRIVLESALVLIGRVESEPVPALLVVIVERRAKIMPVVRRPRPFAIIFIIPAELFWIGPELIFPPRHAILPVRAKF
jgi:hypothetical protein